MKTPYKYIPVVSPIYRQFQQNLNLVLYKGNNIKCPFCEKTFRTWMHNQEYGSCPFCKSAARHRLLYLFLQKHSSILTQTHKILHFAPEQCWEKTLRNRLNSKYITTDISAPDVDVHTDITNLCFEDKSFDIILCSHVLEHIPDERKAITELYRVLVPNGVAYIQVPYNFSGPTDEDLSITDPQERKKRYGQFDHVRQYGIDFKSRLESYGFQVNERYYARELPPTQRKQYGLWDDVIFCCMRVN
jgi:SAM-dependent methyltransferase